MIMRFRRESVEGNIKLRSYELEGVKEIKYVLVGL